MIGEIKKFTVIMYLTIIKFYAPCMSNGYHLLDLSYFNDKLMEFVLKLIFAEGSATLYKVCHSMCRFETIEDEKDLATLMSRHASTV